MKISEELKKKIERLIPNDIVLKKRLLSGDEDAIKDIIKKTTPPTLEDIVEAFENGDREYLYETALRKLELKNLYKELCDECNVQRTQKKSPKRYSKKIPKKFSEESLEER